MQQGEEEEEEEKEEEEAEELRTHLEGPRKSEPIELSSSGIKTADTSGSDAHATVAAMRKHVNNQPMSRTLEPRNWSIYKYLTFFYLEERVLVLKSFS